MFNKLGAPLGVLKQFQWFAKLLQESTFPTVFSQPNYIHWTDPSTFLLNRSLFDYPATSFGHLGFLFGHKSVPSTEALDPNLWKVLVVSVPHRKLVTPTPTLKSWKRKWTNFIIKSPFVAYHSKKNPWKLRLQKI
jgi:hypothetical protein